MHPPDLSDLIGIPFVHNGRSLAGLDCWGLCRMVLQRYGIDAPDIKIACYEAIRVGVLMIGEERSGRWERLQGPEPGCLVAMAIDPDLPGVIQHLGVYVGDGRILHTLEKRGASLVRVDDRFFGKKIQGYYRWKG